MKNPYRKTKIIFTVGPATQSEEMLEKLIHAGVDICRINMAHADHAWTREIIQRVRKVCKNVGRKIAIMMDVKGPEIRTGDVPETFELQKGEIIDFTYGEGIGGVGEDGIRRVDINYPGFSKDINEGDTVLVDSGLIRLLVLEIVHDKHVRCEVLIPGPMGNRRHINLPGVRVNLPALTKKDQGDVDVGIEEDIEFFALSFVREPDDLDIFHRYLSDKGSTAKVIAKIEDQQAIRNLEDIIKASDGLMVARGDLGIECPFEDLPLIQSRAINTCIQHTTPVIVATHMLESMIDSPIPTRAEVTDIANAIREEADCVMLSGETTVGKYPVECVETINRIANRMEAEDGPVLREDLVLKQPKSKMLRSAAYLASELDDAAIVVFTRRGLLPQKLSSLRAKVPVYAFTDNKDTFGQLLIMRGIEPFFLEFDDENPERTIQNAFKALKERKWAKSGAPMVVITNVIAGEKIVDTIQLREVE
ncbi:MULTISPECIES: pyruvate kinase [unclassified Lentimonas]|uniref:pyruvate kinase n=1 Tax=unclassified Lentimonas TaxID=2630993 RepID=UPI001324DF7F|nr:MULTISPECIES: pyruvate kinase [unclassified Lentimonas]CAA6676601.1 Pyruvate kinase (EC [Lentimonas sp. CC4]CAA6684736.1 Pyruvate kinase (EC [Lentimonas sp. CC6]CAA7075372.1 Pyruvate kinase (EC [Lentimonas sp. CC4]CAA7168965.1 Pyruvate kinase (EC [Lentimonas sp. CC21]CAA7182219.1 Pyruvate kinase (EC [Lentimonas sp. CC8]